MFVAYDLPDACSFNCGELKMSILIMKKHRYTLFNYYGDSENNLFTYCHLNTQKRLPKSH